MKRKRIALSVLIPLCILLIIVVVIVCSSRQTSSGENIAVRENLMMEDALYWASSRPYTHSRPETAVECGKITSAATGIAKENGQAYGPPVGKTVYIDTEKPWHIYIDSVLYVREDANQDLICVDGELYAKDPGAGEPPDDLTKIGSIHLEAYDSFPTEQFGVNFADIAGDVFRNKDDQDTLYLEIEYSNGEAIETFRKMNSD